MNNESSLFHFWTIKFRPKFRYIYIYISFELVSFRNSLQNSFGVRNNFTNSRSTLALYIFFRSNRRTLPGIRLSSSKDTEDPVTFCPLELVQLFLLPPLSPPPPHPSSYCRVFPVVFFTSGETTLRAIIVCTRCRELNGETRCYSCTGVETASKNASGIGSLSFKLSSGWSSPVSLFLSGLRRRCDTDED